METRVVSRLERPDSIRGRKIIGVTTRTDGFGNVEAVEIRLDDDRVVAIDPEVEGDRLLLSVIR